MNNEFGPTGKTVYALSNLDSRFRFVGNWEVNLTSNGLHLEMFDENDFLELTFFGTGLNILMHLNSLAAE